MEQKLDQIIGILKDVNNSLSSFDPQWIIVIISFFTLILLAYYTYYTRKIAQVTEKTMRENLRPIVSCELKSGKNYFKPELIQQRPEFKNDTRCIVTNHSKYNLEVFVNLNLKLDNKPEEINDEYAGKKAWPVTSFQAINGHFNLTTKFNLTGVSNININLEVSYKSDIGQLYKNPIQQWHFNKENEVWVNDIGLAV